MKYSGAEAFRLWVVDEAKWARLCDLWKQMGVTVVRTSSLAGSLKWQSPVGLYKDLLMRLQGLLHERGIKHAVMPAAYYYWADASDYAMGAWKSNVINNVNGEQDKWIAACSDYISQIQPDVWYVANEFVLHQEDIDIQTYRAFLARCIRAYHKIKPDLICVVMGFPFTDLKPLLNAGGINEPNTVYDLHYYYNLRGGVPASYDNVGNAYYNATTPQQLDDAKQLFYSYLDNNAGVSLAKSLGKDLWFSEIGTVRLNPNYYQFMVDAFDYMQSRKIGFAPFMSASEGDSANLPSYPTQVFNFDFTELNEIGILASKYMGLPEPESAGGNNFLFWSLLGAFGIVSIVLLASMGRKKDE